MGISRRVSYCLVILCGFALLFPGAAFQNAYSHPTIQKKDCTPVTVKIQISDVFIEWKGTTEEFNDNALGKADVEILYKFWEVLHNFEPAHSESLIEWPTSGKGKRVGVLPATNMEFNDDKTKIAYKQIPHRANQYEYVHQTCKETLNKLAFALALSEIDGEGFTKANKVDAILGGVGTENVVAYRLPEIEKNPDIFERLELTKQTKKNELGIKIVSVSAKNARDYIAKIAEGTDSKLIKALLDDKVIIGISIFEAGLTGKESELASAIVGKGASLLTEEYITNGKKIAENPGIKAFQGKTLKEILAKQPKKFYQEIAELEGKNIVKKIGGSFFGKLAGGPIGWAWFVWDVVGMASSFYSWIQGDNDFIGSGLYFLDLKTQKSQKVSVSVTVPTMYNAYQATLDPKWKNDPRRIFQEMELAGDSPYPELKKHYPKQWAIAHVVLDVKIDEGCNYLYESDPNDPDFSRYLFDQKSGSDSRGPTQTQSIPFDSTETQLIIPTWIKNNAEWWYQGLITDIDFVRGIEYLIAHDIIKSPSIEVVSDIAQPVTSEPDSEGILEIPSWIKNNAEWWSKGLIGDNDFTRGIEFMIKEKIIKSPSIRVVEITTEPSSTPEPVTERTTERTTEPVTERTTEPVTERTTEPVTEPTPEPVKITYSPG